MARSNDVEVIVDSVKIIPSFPLHGISLFSQ
jgi:hypothetical protein